ncbi:MAG: hypothetical protein Q8P05_00200 [Candidatus Diapherotrites archaeon]|nr:hypothetical protein [Candidatus Diapherotrites archaeon]MDZ4256555.1 hypothetical protein [archaeon]
MPSYSHPTKNQSSLFFNALVLFCAVLGILLVITLLFSLGSLANTANLSAIASGNSVGVIATDDVTREEGAFGNISSNVGIFTVVRRGSTVAPLRVDYALTGTANNYGDGIDYVPQTGYVIIPSGFQSADVIIAPIKDTATVGSGFTDLVEHQEQVQLTILPGNGYTTASPSRAVVTILENSPIPNGLNPPDGLRVTAQNIPWSITLGWNDNSTAESRFEIWRGIEALNQGQFRIWDVRPANAEAWTDYGISPSQTYYYRIAAHNQSTGKRTFSEEIMVRT